MDFLGVGGWEVLLILIIALIIWGPGRLVEIGRTLGKMMRALKKVTSDLTAQVSREIEEQEKEEQEKEHPPQQHGDD